MESNSNFLKVGDVVKVSFIQTKEYHSPMSFSGGIVTEIHCMGIRVSANYNKVTRHTFNYFGSGLYNTGAYLIEKI